MLDKLFKLFPNKASNAKKPVRKLASIPNDRMNVSGSKEVTRIMSRAITGEKDLGIVNWKLISGRQAEYLIQVSNATQKNIAVLDACNELRECVIVTRKENYGDTFFLDVVDNLRSLGYKVKEACLADSGFLAKLYEQTVSEIETEMDPESQQLVHALDEELIQVAIERGASDIHIELRETDVKVFMREDGQLQPGTDWGLERTQKLIRVLFMLADEKTKETALSEDRGQSMSIKRIIKGANVKLRVQTETAYPKGKDIVMRVLLEGVDAKVKSLRELGYSEGHLLMLETMLSTPNGAIVVAGVTGSGKSTTLQTLMSNIREADPGKKMYSIEDPPEYILKGVTQIPVKSANKGEKSSKDESPYAETMRNAMRMDPDVLMPGELRDRMSVELFTGMVQSGHKVLTSIHAASAFGTIERLAKLGLDVTEASGRNFISGLIYQTLVPVLCTKCRIPYHGPDWADYKGEGQSGRFVGHTNVVELGHERVEPKSRGVLGGVGLHERIQQVSNPDSLIYVRGPGCPDCKGTGGKGRTVCAEMVLLSSRMRHELRDGNIEGAYQIWKGLRRPGAENDVTASAMAGMSALDHALMKMNNGILSPVDVESALGFLTGYDVDDQILHDSTNDMFKDS